MPTAFPTSRRSRKMRDESLTPLLIQIIDRVPKYRTDKRAIDGYFLPVKPRLDLVLRAGFYNLAIDRTKFSGKQLQDVFDTIEAHDGDINESMANYLTELYFLDQFVGDLMTKLEQYGLAENTIVAFSSDNGPASPFSRKKPRRSSDLNLVGWSGGLRGQKHEDYEGEIRMPFIVRWPGHVPAGKINRDSDFSALDWLPTISRAAGVKINAGNFHGEDVLDIWLGSDRSSDIPLFWKRSMKIDNWRVHFHGRQAVELYDIANDSGETTNLVDKHPNVVAEATRRRNQWLQGLPGDAWWRKRVATSSGN